MLTFVKRKILVCSSKECAFNNYLDNTTCGALYLQNIILPVWLCSHLAFITRALLTIFKLQTKDMILQFISCPLFLEHLWNLPLQYIIETKCSGRLVITIYLTISVCAFRNEDKITMLQCTKT